MEDKVHHDINELVCKLRDVVNLKNDLKDCRDADIINILDSLLDMNESSIKENTEFTIEDVFLSLLTHESNVIVAKTAKIIAEIAKTERGREKCTSSNFVKTLMALLNRNDIDILTQTSRALGNICYENVLGIQMIQENDGLKYILRVLNRAVSLGDAEGAEFLRNAVAGFLLNYLTDEEVLQKQALDQGLIPIICDVLEIDGPKCRKAAIHVLLTLEILNDSGIQFLDEKLTKILVDVLASDLASEFPKMCLELLYLLAENENAKVLLAKAGVCELLLKLLEKHVPKCVDLESKSILITACNLIILIITGEESMNFLYADSKGIVYTKLVDWLESSCEEDFQITAVLAMGNFATTDSHCQQMVAQGVHRHLLRLLEKNSNINGDIRFQHALLSAVRNLVIPPANKSIMLKDGLINVVYPMLEIPTFPVVFKLLGTLRIVIDGQQEAASSLGSREDLVKKVIAWCDTKDHAGIQGEANRLLAWLVIHSRDKDVVSLIVKHGAIEYLVKMITGPHALMQNEAFLSLTIMSAMSLKECEDKLIEANIGKALKQFFEISAKNLELPIIENSITFANMMIKSDILKDHLKQSQLLDDLKNSKNSATWTNSLIEKSNMLLSSLDD